MSEILEQPAPAPETAIEQPAPAPSVKQPTPEEIKRAEIKAQQEKSIAEAKAAQEKVNARIATLKTYEGKTFKRIGGNENTTFKIIRYEGIGKLSNGDLAHLFRVERFNPGAIYTPPATQFLAEHQEIEVKPAPAKEII